MYSANQKSLIKEALVSAKQRLWDGTGGLNALRSRQICYAIGKGTEGQTLAWQLINDRMGWKSCYGLEWWLIIRGYGPCTDENMQAYRHRWLDALIKEFS